MPQDSAILSLASLNDDLLFENVAEGIELLKNNLDRLENSARLLSEAGDQSSAEILKHIATEEAAKVLILLDVIRCPLTSLDARRQTLARWTNHLWKGIYAEACDRPPVDFEEVRRNIEEDIQRYHLDGPFGVDWIFPNQITASRERLMYVDYVHDLTQEPQDATEWWTSPIDSGFEIIPSPCVKTVQALCSLGVTNVDGLKMIAQIWRPVVLGSSLSQADVNGLIRTTANNLLNHGIANEAWITDTWPSAIWNWPFPLWSFHPKPAKEKERLEDLHQERKNEIERVAEIEKQRDPPPAISEEQVLQMHEAYMRQKTAEDKRRSELTKDRGTGFASIILSPEDQDFIHDVNAPEYLHLRDMWRNLSREEQIALLALAWLTRYTIPNWPRVYQDAKEKFNTVEEHYHLGCAHEWLEGYRRWKGEQIHPWRLPSV